jgi:hypothetical protein
MKAAQWIGITTYSCTVVKWIVGLRAGSAAKPLPWLREGRQRRSPIHLTAVHKYLFLRQLTRRAVGGLGRAAMFDAALTIAVALLFRAVIVVIRRPTPARLKETVKSRATRPDAIA